MKRDVVVYFGMGFLPDRNAVACREQALAYLAREAGYKPVLIGIKECITFGKFEKSLYQDTLCYTIKYAKSFLEKVRDMCTIKKTLIRILEDVGVDKIKCFIMQDYQLGPMMQLRRYCRANGISYVADIMDWFTPTRDSTIAKNICKTVDTYFRMHWFYPRLENKIYISYKFAKYFGDNQKNNILVLPCTTKDLPAFLQCDENRKQNITITFAGFLGRKCEKEKLDWIIRALFENKSNIKLNVIGLTKEEFALKVPELATCVTENIHFWGCLPRTECLKVLHQSDFSIIARKHNNLTEYGFSSKICEAFSCGVPVIATNNSDNTVYIKAGVTGYICEANYESLKELLKKIEKVDLNTLSKMRCALRLNNPLSVNKYIDKFSAFLDSMRI